LDLAGASGMVALPTPWLAPASGGSRGRLAAFRRRGLAGWGATYDGCRQGLIRERPTDARGWSGPARGVELRYAMSALPAHGMSSANRRINAQQLRVILFRLVAQRDLVNTFLLCVMCRKFQLFDGRADSPIGPFEEGKPQRIGHASGTLAEQSICDRLGVRNISCHPCWCGAAGVSREAPQRKRRHEDASRFTDIAVERSARLSRRNVP
jgi:hypothetical protein